MPNVTTAWDLIGYSGTEYVRIVGGRALYEAVDYDDSRGGRLVRLQRLDTTNGLRNISRYVHPDTPMEIVPDEEVK